MSRGWPFHPWRLECRWEGNRRASTACCLKRNPSSLCPLTAMPVISKWTVFSSLWSSRSMCHVPFTKETLLFVPVCPAHRPSDSSHRAENQNTRVSSLVYRDQQSFYQLGLQIPSMVAYRRSTFQMFLAMNPSSLKKLMTDQ